MLYARPAKLWNHTQRLLWKTISPFGKELVIYREKKKKKSQKFPGGLVGKGSSEVTAVVWGQSLA